MASTQRQTRRTSARQGDGDDDAPPAKKQKMDNAIRPAAKQASSKKGMDASKVYDQAEGDFMFTRKPKKVAAAKAPAAERSEEPQNDEAAPTKRGRKRKSSESVPTESTASQHEPPRRSKRLSGEKEAEKNEQQGNGSSFAVPDKTQPQRAGLSPVPRSEAGNLEVAKKRRDTKIALPFADTPVIQRNKEMRKTSGERRRSSSTMRGRRASSLIDNGVSNALPHENVQSEEFYKHISQDLPEPRRMKQLLVWCGARALSDKSSGPPADVNSSLAARTIQDEILKDFANKSEMCDWFNREDDAKPAVLVRKPNPRNQQNAAKLVELEKEVKRLEEEKSTWDKLLSSLASSLPSESSKARSTQLDASELDDVEQAECLKLLSTQDESTAKAKTRLKEATDSLEFKIDTFADGVHRLGQLGNVVDEAVEKVVKDASESLKHRDDARATRGGERLGVGDLLRAFSRAAS